MALIRAHAELRLPLHTVQTPALGAACSTVQVSHCWWAWCRRADALLRRGCSASRAHAVDDAVLFPMPGNWVVNA